MFIFNVYVVSICFVPGTVLGVVNQSDTVPLVKEFTGPVEETQATELLSGVIDAVSVVRRHRCALPTRVQEVSPEATCV